MKYSPLLLILVIYSCVSMKVAQVEADNLKQSSSGYVFENDSLRITYRFWNMNGRMQYDIYNKLNKPLYIDWKTSAYIPNDRMISYWRDETNMESVSSAYYWGAGIASGSAKAKAVRMERIAVMPPRSMITQNSFRILKSHTDIPTSGQFNQDNSPFKFRNYVTISDNEKFEGKTSSITNEFYVSSVKKVRKSKMKKDERAFYTILWK